MFCSYLIMISTAKITCIMIKSEINDWLNTTFGFKYILSIYIHVDGLGNLQEGILLYMYIQIYTCYLSFWGRQIHLSILC